MNATTRHKPLNFNIFDKSSCNFPKIYNFKFVEYNL